MSHDHNEPHIGIPGYLVIFGILIVGTIVTYLAAQIDMDWIFPGMNTLVALLIAFFKMSVVVLYFMHVRWGGKLIWITIAASFFWLIIMFAFTLQDYLTRQTGIFTS